MASTDPRQAGGALSEALPAAQSLARRFGLRGWLWVVNLGLAVWLGWMIWGLMALREGRATGSLRPSAPKEGAAERGAPETPPDYAAIGRRNIFGTGAPPPAASSAPAPGPTQLQLRLLGTVAGGPAFARAIIEETASKSQNLYRIDDVVQGARIVEIQRNRVVLLVGGRQETLELAVSSLQASGAEGDGVRTMPARAPAPREAVRVMSPTEFEINKRALLARIGGLESVMAKASLEPYMVDGQTKGLRLTGIEGVSMAAFVGIQNGDVITTVNGQELTSMQKAYQVFQKARSQPELNVQLLRGDQAKALQFRLTPSE